MFKSSYSLLGYDIVIFDPLAAHLNLTGQLNRSVSLETPHYTPLRDIYDRRVKEFQSLLQLGKVVVCLVPPPTSIRNFNTDDSFRVVDAVGVCAATVEGAGLNVENRAQGPLKLFYEASKGALRYEAILQDPMAEAFLFITGTPTIVGSYVRVGEGHLLFTPHFTDKGLTFVAGVVAWYGAITQAIAYQAVPLWLSGAALDVERQEQEKVDLLDEQVKAITIEYEEAVNTVDELRAWKRLIYATGPELEEQVRRALNLFGFAVEPGLPGRDDFIVEADGAPAVVEVKGVTGSASETHAAQLEKWASTYTADHGGVAPKGILVVNAFRDKPLQGRTQAIFPDQMLRYSEQREHCLVSGVQLLGMVVEVLADPARAIVVRRRLMETRGILQGGDDYRTFLVESPAAKGEQG